MSVDVAIDFLKLPILFGIIFILPGRVFLRPFAQRLFPHEVGFYSVIFSAFIVGSVFYLVVGVLGFAIANVFFRDWHLALLALVITLIIMQTQKRMVICKPRRDSNAGLNRPQSRILIAVTVLAGFIGLLNFDDRSLADCLYNSTEAALVNIIDLSSPMNELIQRYLNEPPAPFDFQTRVLGIVISWGQREGNVFILILFLTAFKLAGYNLAYIFVGCWLFLGVFSLIYRLFGRFIPALLVAFLVVIHPVLLARHVLDENTIVLMSLLALFNGLLVHRIPGVALGLLIAWALATSHELWLPLSVFAAVHWGLNRWSLRGGFKVAVAVAVASLPTLVHHAMALGSPFQFESWTEFEPITHHFFGSAFQYRGLLNWPFVPEMVRTPYTVFPTLLLFPAYFIHESGIALSGMTLAGVLLFLIRQPRAALPYVLFTLIFFMCIAVQSNWMEPKKMGVSLQMAVPVIIGLGFLFSEASRRNALSASVLLTVISTGLVLGFHHFTKDLSFPPDPRTRDYLPTINDKPFLDPEHGEKNYNRYIVIGNTPETPDAVEFERTNLLDLDWWPNLKALPNRFNYPRIGLALRSTIADLLFSDFAYFEKKSHWLMIQSIKSGIIHGPGQEEMQRKSGSARLKQPSDFLAGRFGKKNGPMRFRIPLSDSWLSAAPVSPVEDKAPPDVFIRPGEVRMVHSLRASSNGYHRVVLMTADKIRFQMFAFFYAESEPNPYWDLGIYQSADSESIVVETERPSLVEVWQVMSAFPRKIYKWDGLVEDDGRLALSPPYADTR